ncbi:tetratricopeptide repeat protein [Teichococcus coralli]|uniref:tetratricopeptide repeat protein n=1 Tax=Teichococcus coralli TaxID=2545983 RepID=UPI0022A73178|nr:tetratricopeptide repeat protein [Pseudoroseomonas coralli]
MLREAVARHQAGDLEGAAARYERLLAVRPDDANALNLLGLVFRQRGDLPRALGLIRRAVALQPAAPVFLATLGGTLAEAGQLAAAVEALRAALAIRPNDPTSLRNLGQALCGLGRSGEALAPLRRAVALAPAAGEAHLALAHACREAGKTAAAAAAARAALLLPNLAPQLAEQARFLLAALGEGAAPDRAPATYVRDLFDQYAPRFERDLEDKLAYRTPAALADLLAEAGLAADGSRQVLDLGCGTGLSGRALAPFAHRLEGVDLSPRMLAEAARQGCYAALHEADLLAFLPRHPGQFDLIAAADVLNYLGELRPALAGMATALRPGGYLAFSVESGAGDTYALGPGLRYRHDLPALRALLAALDLRILAERSLVLRQELGQPVAGAAFVLRVA